MATNSLKLKQVNVELVRDVLKREKFGTKASISNATGLSIATCGNILKELLSTGEVAETDLEASKGGRPARRFVYNGNHAYVAVVYGRMEGSRKILSFVVSNLVGSHVYEGSREYAEITVREFEGLIEFLVEIYPDIKVLGIGLPGVVSNGITGICDLEKLSRFDFGNHFSIKYGLDVVVENDVNSTAFGFYRKNGYSASESLVYIYYPVEGKAGAGIIVNGGILRGKTNFAGEVSFLPLGIDPERQGDIQKKPTLFCEFVAKTITSVNCIVNPGIFVLSGYCFTEEQIDSIKERLKRLNPRDHLPELIFEEDIHDSYIHGLISMALERLSCNIKIIEK